MQYIFVHGLGQNKNSWDKTISFISTSINVVCPDLIALLNNDEISYANLYRRFSNYCNSLSEPLNFCGLSLGGVIALNYAIDNPAKMQSLVLIGAQYKMPKTLLKLQNTIFRFMPKSTFRNMGFQKEDFMKLTNSMLDLDFSDKLKDVSCATLIVCGEKDGANKKAANELAVSIPKANIRFIKNAKHEVNVDSPNELAHVLESFYQG